MSYILMELIVIIVPKDTTALTRTTLLRYLQQLDQYHMARHNHIAVKGIGSLSLPKKSAGRVLLDTIVVMLATLKL